MTAAEDKEPKAGAAADAAGEAQAESAKAAGAAAGEVAGAADANEGAETVAAEVIDFDAARAQASEGDGADAADADAIEDADGASDAGANAAGKDADGTDLADELLKAAQDKAAELQDRYARLQAEWDNFRKRTSAERDSERARAAENLVKDLLPVLDDLERALKHARESGEGGTLADGVEAVQTKFLQILGKHKVSQVEADAQPFDVNCHQAVGTTENASVPEETVVQVYQQGYRMGDKVIRPAMVVTSTGGPAREPDDGADTAGAAPAGDGGQEG